MRGTLECIAAALEARWNSVGTAVVYASGTLSLALVETLVHLPSGILPAYSAQPVDFDDSLLSVLEDADLPSDWRGDPPPVSTRTIGDSWTVAGRSVVLRVPSVVVPMEFNYVFNPRHADFTRVRIAAPLVFPFDPGSRDREGAGAGHRIRSRAAAYHPSSAGTRL